jgi:parallel beta-helix repeat protein
MKIFNTILLFCSFILLLVQCKPAEVTGYTFTKENINAEFQKALITAKDGDTFSLPEGTFEFKRSISLNDTPNISIIGKGKGKTILSFKNQVEGAEGMLIKNVQGIRLEGFTISDSKGDAIKVQDCTNVIMRDLETTWTTGKLATNGAYGLYPVSSTNVLMEDCEASFAMDAGIYVGQSNNVVVRNNYVHNNVAGLEIENTIEGEVYGNIAKNNTGGMLIFDMPDLPQVNGDRIKFYDNLMENNNGENFAPKGMVVSTIPPGSGMVIMSHSNIEAYNNTIRGHKTLGIAVNSWLFTGQPYKDQNFDPFATNINVHDNVIEGTSGPADITTDYGKLIHATLDGKAYDFIIDGIFKPGEDPSYCFKNNGEVSFVNLNAGMGADPESIRKNLNHDMSSFDCDLPNFDTSDHDAWLAVE